MANELDEMTGPVNGAGRDINVIEKQLPVRVGWGSTLFEIVLSGLCATSSSIRFRLKMPRRSSIRCAGILWRRTATAFRQKSRD